MSVGIVSNASMSDRFDSLTFRAGSMELQNSVRFAHELLPTLRFGRNSMEGRVSQRESELRSAQP